MPSLLTFNPFDCFSLCEYVNYIFFLQEGAAAIAEGKPAPALSESSDIRPLNLEDFKFAHEQVTRRIYEKYMIFIICRGDKKGGLGNKSKWIQVKRDNFLYGSNMFGRFTRNSVYYFFFEL